MVYLQYLERPPAGSALKQISGPATNSVVQMLRRRRDPLGCARDSEARFGPVHVVNLFGDKWIAACGPEAAERILMNKDRAFANGPGWSPLISPFFERGLMLLDAAEHRRHRTLMQQAFTPAALKGYLQLMQPVVRRHIDALPTGSVEAGTPVRIYSHLKQLTLDVALEVFMGARLSRAEADRINSAFIDNLRAVGSIVRGPVPGGRWRKGLRGRKILEEFLAERIPVARRRETADLLSVLCRAADDDGGGCTDADVINHMIFLLMAAHDTTTTTLANMVYHMAAAPDWQQRARRQSLARNPDLSYDDLAELGDLELIFKESARLCPPLQVQLRKSVRDTEVCGYFVPAGYTVYIPTDANHRRGEIWSHPDVFDPGRFGAERAEHKAHRLAWAPFGAGVHKCIGLYFAQIEIKIILHHLLRDYEWTVPATYELPLDVSALPAPKDKLPITLHYR
ncbi:cytochrome P450 [Nocardia mexicana]|uniref:Cytochrome P450 n=1 Tax=Nocardia mexicana TaxID=279262 RepID=A0A370HED5_9NOCA|nr:cytochrome P450 [Nocardia mexicana]RDI55583.1 cytochrome P450 [Nocardia mexicana]